MTTTGPKDDIPPQRRGSSAVHRPSVLLTRRKEMPRVQEEEAVEEADEDATESDCEDVDLPTSERLNAAAVSLLTLSEHERDAECTPHTFLS